MKRIVLCADDYGQAVGITEGILDLVKRKRLSAVSCLVNKTTFPADALRLKPYQKDIDIGLHWNLTEGYAHSAVYQKTYGPVFFPLSVLLRKAFFRQLSWDILREELIAQLTSFKTAFGFLPDYIDGHQHIHQFPILRDVLINVYMHFLSQHHVYIRWVNLKPMGWLGCEFKKRIIHFTGTKVLGRKLRNKKVPHNKSFAGIYSFKQGMRYQQLFPQFLTEVDDKGIILCHPARTITPNDPLGKARIEEYNYFASDQFLKDCDARKIHLEKFF
ncbi:MAG: ChbG/HpnK family deacetylase [Gammaproteobacteria bacterium]|nr:ChbG/HpnK family deacetylase [Gammaproteobacteria bacterium]